MKLGNSLYNKKIINQKAFTIVELLLVVVVIGILAAISIVSYSGITNKAVQATIKSDLNNAYKKIQLFYAENGFYPNSVTDCPSPVSANLCLSSSSGNVFDYYIYNNSTSPLTYSLSIFNNILKTRNVIDEKGVSSLTASSFKNIEGGWGFSCAIGGDDKLYCWGHNLAGQFGDNTLINKKIPSVSPMDGVLSGKTIKDVATGATHVCVVASDDKVYCSGQNTYGQLGNNSTIDSSIFVAVDTSGVLSGKTIKDVTARDWHTCVLTSDGKVYCWGYNLYGGLGNNTTTNSSIPVAVNTSGVLSGKTIKSISDQYHSVCAIASDNKAYCWGRNTSGQLGNNSTTNSSVPVAVHTSGVLSGKTIKSMTSGALHTCVIASDNNVYCWGLNDTGQMGDNTSTAYRTVPNAIYTAGALNGKTVSSISSGGHHVCVKTTESKVYCWGRNTYGQLGNNLSSDSLVATPLYVNGVLSGKNIRNIYISGIYHSCLESTEEKIYCWGRNDSGQLGDNTTTQSLVPVNTYLPM